MVAAGAGVTVPITLYVLAEGRYQPTNFPSFTVDPTQHRLGLQHQLEQLRDALEQAGFAATMNRGWLVGVDRAACRSRQISSPT